MRRSQPNRHAITRAKRAVSSHNKKSVRIHCQEFAMGS